MPLLGAALAGRPWAAYLELPPLTRYVDHTPFSWSAFLGLAAFTLAVVAPFLWRLARNPRTQVETRPTRTRSLPWWGWLGVSIVVVAWVLAWNRFEWFAPWQRHTFTPLWLGYVLVLNALTWRRTGRCLLTHRRRWFLGLFPASALFWWYFEFLNRFVQNWYYLGVEEFTAPEYVLFASVSFSTVLPAVLSTLEWLQSFPRLNLAGTGLWRAPAVPRPGAAIILGFALAGCVLISLWPDYLFPLVWVAPLFVITGFQGLRREATVLAPLGHGDWRPALLPALAALQCGLFWEMWNAGSLAHWEYAIPFVDRFHLFEMPALGYAGYLPFGLECLAVASLLGGGWRWGSGE